MKATEARTISELSTNTELIGIIEKIREAASNGKYQITSYGLEHETINALKEKGYTVNGYGGGSGIQFDIIWRKR